MLTSDDLYESMHWRELDLRDKLDARLQLSFTLATALIGAISFLVSNVDTGHTLHTADDVFFALLFLTFALLLLAGVFFFRSSAGSFFRRQKNIYKTLPVSLELDAYRRQWDEAIANHPAQTAGKTTAEELRKLLVKTYLNSQQINAAINDQRARNIARMNELIFAAALLIVAAFAVFYVGGLNKTNFEKPQKIEITAPVDVRNTPPAAQDRYVFWFPPASYFHATAPAPTPAPRKGRRHQETAR